MSRRIISLLKILAMIGAFLSGFVALAQCTDSTKRNPIGDNRAGADSPDASTAQSNDANNPSGTKMQSASTIAVRVVTPHGLLLRNLALIGPDGEVFLDQNGVALIPAKWHSICVFDPQTNRMSPPFPVVRSSQGPTVLVVKFAAPSSDDRPRFEPSTATLQSPVDGVEF